MNNDLYIQGLLEIQELTDKAMQRIEDLHAKNMSMFSTTNPTLAYLFGIYDYKDYWEMKDKDGVVRIRIGVL